MVSSVLLFLRVFPNNLFAKKYKKLALKYLEYKFYLDDDEAEKAIESMKIVVKSPEIKPEAKLRVLTDFVNFVGDNPQYETDLVEATAMVSDTNDSKTVIELGQYYLAKDDKVRALEYFEEGLQLEPNNFNVLKNGYKLIILDNIITIMACSVKIEGFIEN